MNSYSFCIQKKKKRSNNKKHRKNIRVQAIFNLWYILYQKYYIERGKKNKHEMELVIVNIERKRKKNKKN